MKARIPLPNDLKSAVKKGIAAEWKKIQKEKSLEMAQRCLKVYLYVLNRDYGFGKKRLTDFYNRYGKMWDIEEMTEKGGQTIVHLKHGDDRAEVEIEELEAEQ